jgi:hypothetical protein
MKISVQKEAIASLLGTLEANHKLEEATPHGRDSNTHPRVTNVCSFIGRERRPVRASALASMDRIFLSTPSDTGLAEGIVVRRQLAQLSQVCQRISLSARDMRCGILLIR